MKPKSTSSTFTASKGTTTVAVLAVLSLLGSAYSTSAADAGWAGTANGSWSDPANWSSGAPATSGDSVTFGYLDLPANTTITATIDGAWGQSGSVTGISFGSDNGGRNNGYTLMMEEGVSLEIGAGGIDIQKVVTNSLVSLWGNYQLQQDQRWSLAGTGWNAGTLRMNGNLSGNANITINTAGAQVAFTNGHSNTFTGAFTLEKGTITLTGAEQLNRLGSNALTFRNTSSSITPTLNFARLAGDGQAFTFATPLHFEDTLSTRSIQFNETTATNSSIAMTGEWSGALDHSLRFASNHRDDLIVRLQTDGSTLTSTRTFGSQANSALYLISGSYSIESEDALGRDNSLSVSLGNGNSARFSHTNLYTKDEIDIASTLYINSTYHGTTDNARSSSVRVGLTEAGASTYSGNVHLQAVTANADQYKSRVGNLTLIAAEGGVATFSGNIADHGNGTDVASVAIGAADGQRGGTVILTGANNSYKGGTSVVQGTTLLANGGSGASGSATGSGNLLVGYDAANISGDVTSGQSYITGIADTSGLHVGQSISGNGIAAGTFITYIHTGIAGRIEISENATATSTGAALSAAAETGILGGTGRIRPGADAQIIVANGSTLAPGDGVNSDGMGTLTLDGSATTAPLLTMETGAKLQFQFDSDSLRSDKLTFWNYTDGDLVLNDTTLEILLTGSASPGSYKVTLFDFYADSGTTLVDNLLLDGLLGQFNLSFSDPGVTGASLLFGEAEGTIDLSYSVIPEPSSLSLIGAGMALWAGLNRRRNRFSKI